MLLQSNNAFPGEAPARPSARRSRRSDGANPGDTLVVAGHSGALYDIMGDGNGSMCMGLGLSNEDGSPLTDDSPSSNRFPKDEDGKVANFGDIWKVVIYPSGARFAYRVNLQPKALFVDEYAR